MKKYLKYSLVFIFIFLFGFKDIQAKDFIIHSKNAILYNLDNDTIVYEVNSEEETYIASLTKITTVLVAIEHITDINNKVTLTDDVFKGLKEANASLAGFKVGQQVTYLDLLYGAMLPSGADATRALAINLAGSEEEFVEWMNEKAKDLGLEHTHYVNTSGLDVNDHYSTVKDIALILKEALKNETFKKIYTTDKYTTSDGLITMRSTISKYNEKFNITINYIDGAKTGFTNKAGYCLSTLAYDEDIPYILITTGADNKSKQPLHIMDAKTIYDYFFEQYEKYPIIKLGDVLKTVKINYSDISSIDIVATDTVYQYLKKDMLAFLEYRYDGKEEINAPMKEGEKIGTVSIYYQNALIDKIDVILPTTISFSFVAYLNANTFIWLILIMLGGIIFVKSRKCSSRNS